jgi:dipeptidyl aminopeptidase/acylaminoacyl peptidase
LEDLGLGYPEQTCEIQGAVVWYGPTNFLMMDEQLSASGLLPPVGFRHNEPDSPESLLLGDTITKIPEKVQKANPENYIGEKAPPMLIQHGRKDPVVPVQQSIEFVQKLKQKFGEQNIILEIIENAEHADPAFETNDNIERVLKFIKRHILYMDNLDV